MPERKTVRQGFELNHRIILTLLFTDLILGIMSMFSGFTNQISGWVASKTGGGQPAAEEDPNVQVSLDRIAQIFHKTLGIPEQQGSQLC